MDKYDIDIERTAHPMHNLDNFGRHIGCLLNTNDADDE